MKTWSRNLSELVLGVLLATGGATFPQRAGAAAPPVIITSPTNGSVLSAPASFTVRTSVSGGGNSVAQVEFFEGTNSLGVDVNNPYRIDVTALAAGAYTLSAVLTDTNGDKSSNSVDIIVNALPDVVITSPADGSGLIAPATFMLQAAATDADGAVTRLAFLRGTTSLGVATTNPAAVAIRNLGSGNYRFTVTATDNLGGTRSANVDLVVKARPSVAISSPAAGARLTTVTNVFSGTASDSHGVASVEASVNSGGFAAVNGTSQWNSALVLPPGTNVVRVRAIDIFGNPSLTNTRSVFQVVTSALTVTVTGNGTVSGLTNGQILEVNRGYQITAVPGTGHVFSNWTGPVSSTLPALKFLMQSNLALTANFVPNPFLRVAGTFNGLSYETNEAHHESSGEFKLKVNTSGRFSASLRVGGQRSRASGALDLEGRATSTIPRPGLSPLTVNWAVDLHGLDQVSGDVSDGNWVAALLGDRAIYNPLTNPAPLEARYTLVVKPDMDSASPPGDGWGTLRVARNGLGVLSGSLPDGTRFARKAPVSKDGAWPLYVPLYQLRGSVLGWIQFDTNAPSDDFRGRVDWFRPSQAGVVFYPNGFTNQSTLSGSRYAAPVSSTDRVLALTDGDVILSGGNLSQTWTNSFILGLNHRITNTSPNSLKVSLVPGSGLFKGTFLDPDANRTLNFAGAVLQKSTNGAGYFLGTNQAGQVLIEPRP